MKTIILIWACAQQPIVYEAPIRPYGLNLQPANLPERPRAPVTFDAGARGASPLVIENPYFRSP
jgi:hypothetical protein